MSSGADESNRREFQKTPSSLDGSMTSPIKDNVVVGRGRGRGRVAETGVQQETPKIGMNKQPRPTNPSGRASLFRKPTNANWIGKNDGKVNDDREDDDDDRLEDYDDSWEDEAKLIDSDDGSSEACA